MALLTGGSCCAPGSWYAREVEVWIIMTQILESELVYAWEVHLAAVCEVQT